MTRRLLAVLAAGLFAAAPVTLHAQSISLAGGLSLPVSDFGNAEQSGYNATLGLNFGAPLVPVGARIEGSINSFNHQNNLPSGDTRVLGVSANAIVSLGMPYLIGGVGYYAARSSFTGLPDSNTNSSAGFNIGAGLSFPLPSLSPFVEVRYHQLMGDNSGIKFVPITFGIKF